MKKVKQLLAFMLTAFALNSMAQQPFTPGNIVVCRLGDGTIAQSTNGFPLFLDEYTPTGTLVQSIPMPTVASGSNNRLTMTGTQNDVCFINLSADGRYIVLPGCNQQVGASNTTRTAAVVGLIDYNATINTATTIPAFPGIVANVPGPSAISDNGNNIWVTGLQSGNSNLRYTAAGSGTSTAIYSDATRGIYGLAIVDGQLIASIRPNPEEISAIGTGLPTTAGQTPTALPGLSSTDGSLSANIFKFVDLNPSIPGVDVLYVSAGNLGLKKFSLVGGVWISNGLLKANVTDSYGGLTAEVSGSSVDLFITNGINNSILTQLIKITDNSGYNGTIAGTSTVLDDVATRYGAVTQSTNLARYFGVALVPQAPSVRLSVKAFLQGAYNSSLSRHKDVTTAWASVLNANALNQPYNTTPFNYAGTESVSNGFFTSNSGASTDILDWVLVELKDASNTTVVARKAAFIREDGQIVSTDGTSPVSFSEVSDGNYYVVIKHRNHLSVRSANTVALSSTTTSYDFTTGQGQAFTNGALSNTPMAAKDLTGTSTSVTLLWGGNANSDNLVRASAAANVNDYLTLMSPANLNGNTSTILTNVYRAVDMNLDGTVRASAAANLNDYLVLMSPGILNGNTSNILAAHQ